MSHYWSNSILTDQRCHTQLVLKITTQAEDEQDTDTRK